MNVDFFKHNLGKEENESIKKVMESTFLSTGPVTKRFEEKFAEYLNTNFCVGVSSWTSGNFITLKALGIGIGDEIITTPMSFIATSNTIIQSGAIPVFVDVEEETGNINVEKIESAITEKTKAIIPVHLYGQMCDMKAINEIARKYNLFVIEDAAHCVEGQRDGIGPGQLSDAAVFSFYATKNITSGEGGAIVTNNRDLYDNLIKYRLHGMSKSASERHTDTNYQHWDMELLGYKCNMYDLQASLLEPQLKNIEKYLQARENICMQYENSLSSFKNIKFPKVMKNSKHARHLFTIWVEPSKRDEIIYNLENSKISVTVNYRAIHLLSYYKKTFGFKNGVLPIAERIGDSTITLPMYPKMSEAELKYVISVLKKVI